MRQINLFLLLLIAYSCNTPISEIHSIDPRSWNENNMKLSDFSDDIQYIPLDNQYSYVARIPIIKGNFMYSNIKDTGIVQFDRQGTMIRNIGRYGRGPGEYLYGMNFDVEERTGTIYVLDGKRINIYSKTGRYIRNISIEELGEQFNGIYYFNSHLFIPKTISGLFPKYNWIILDTVGHLIKKKENTVPSITANTGGVLHVFKFQDKIYYSNWYDDSVYCILPNFDYRVSYVYNVGDKRLPRTSLSTDPPTYMKQMGQYFIHGGLFETNRFLFVNYRLDKSSIAMLDKINGKLYMNYHIRNGNRPMTCGIPNDLDGGLMFTFSDYSYMTENNIEYLIGFIDPFELKSHIASAEFKKSNPKYLEKKNALEKFANCIKETDNQILMIIKLKK